MTVAGFKSISDERTADILPLTVLAGANSSGKSSVMQLLLLLKQTLEAGFDPGPLLLYGENVKFTTMEQLIPRTTARELPSVIKMGLHSGPSQLTIEFSVQPKATVEISSVSFSAHPRPSWKLTPLMSGCDLRTTLEHIVQTDIEIYTVLSDDMQKLINDHAVLHIERDRFFLIPRAESRAGIGSHFYLLELTLPYSRFRAAIGGIIHVTGIRGNPERTYPSTAIGNTFPGTFHPYAPSIIAGWQAGRADDRLAGLWDDLNRLAMTWKVEARPVNEAQVEVRVGRLPRATRGGARDLVNISDVGLGVSQVLPVLVALRAAQPGQLVYIEQPEIHLHPRAQVTLGGILAEAAARGVRVVAETHSSLLLLGIQTAIAEGKVPPTDVVFHWFSRDESGQTNIDSVTPADDGSFGDWPEDFADVEIKAGRHYFEAARSVQLKKKGRAS